MDKIAIIIVHYNTDEDTTAVLASLAALKAGDYQVRTFVIDNASKTRIYYPQTPPLPPNWYAPIPIWASPAAII
ncbi:hypothetical protein IJJ12_03405 [bacterium]|nr:hypothetical protein [bacterium]